MKLNSKIMMLVAIMACAFTLQVSAQNVPSIPSKSKVKKSGNVVWGTQYDYLSTRYIDYDDISNYDRGQLRVLRNSIYARHGRIFQDAELREYFNQQSWYYGTRKEIPESEFNKYEKANIAFLKKYENLPYR